MIKEISLNLNYLHLFSLGPKELITLFFKTEFFEKKVESFIPQRSSLFLIDFNEQEASLIFPNVTDLSIFEKKLTLMHR